MPTSLMVVTWESVPVKDALTGVTTQSTENWEAMVHMGTTEMACVQHCSAHLCHWTHTSGSGIALLPR